MVRHAVQSAAEIHYKVFLDFSEDAIYGFSMVFLWFFYGKTTEKPQKNHDFSGVATVRVRGISL